MRSVRVRPAATPDREALCRLYHEFHEFHVRGAPDRLLSLGEPPAAYAQTDLYFAPLNGRLVLERGGALLPLVPVGDDQFYAEVTETRGLPVASMRNRDGKITHVMLGGELYHRIKPDLSLNLNLRIPLPMR